CFSPPPFLPCIGLSERFPTATKVRSKTIPFQKEHLDETCLSQSGAQLFTSHSRRRSSRRSRFPRFSSACINRSCPRCEVFERRHRAGPRQASVFDAYRPSR